MQWVVAFLLYHRRLSFGLTLYHTTGSACGFLPATKKLRAMAYRMFILYSKMVKPLKRGGTWKCENKKHSQAELLEKLDTSSLLTPDVPNSSKS